MDNAESPRFEQKSDRCRRYSLSKGRNHAAGDEDEFCHSLEISPERESVYASMHKSNDIYVGKTRKQKGQTNKLMHKNNHRSIDRSSKNIELLYASP
jgi:hypothetical protein